MNNLPYDVKRMIEGIHENTLNSKRSVSVALSFCNIISSEDNGPDASLLATVQAEINKTDRNLSNILDLVKRLLG